MVIAERRVTGVSGTVKYIVNLEKIGYEVFLGGDEAPRNGHQVRSSFKLILEEGLERRGISWGGIFG